jgi:hypothetical protein
MSASAGKWIICPECEGDGATSKHLGVINAEDWDPEEMEGYMAGKYDRRCGCCGGSGKMREGNVSSFYEKEAEREAAYRYACAEDGRRCDW